MWVGNLFLVLLNVPLIRIWVRVLEVPQRVLFPTIVGFACIGTFSLNLNRTTPMRSPSSASWATYFTRPISLALLSGAAEPSELIG